MWHVSSRSGVATLRTAIHLLLTYCPHLLLRAVLRRAAADRRIAGRAAIDRYLLAAEPGSQQKIRSIDLRRPDETDGQTDRRTPDSCIDPAPHTICRQCQRDVYDTYTDFTDVSGNLWRYCSKKQVATVGW